MYEWLNQPAPEAAGLVVSRDPRQFPCGYFSSETGEGSAGAFMWFADEREMLAFIREAEPGLYEPAPAALATMQRAIAAVEADVAAGSGALTPALLDRINEAFCDFMLVRWWGHFDDLLSGRGEFACDLREGFREDAEETAWPKPVADDEMDAFVEYLGGYGA